MSQFSVIFNPATDNKAEVLAQVDQLFSLFGALGLGASAEDNDTAGDSAPVAGVTHDNTGLPWDGRIHSTPATLTAKGLWRAKKNTDAALKAAVEAELRGGTVQAAPAPAGLQMPALQMPASIVQPPAAPTTFEQLVKLLADNANTPANPAGKIPAGWAEQAMVQLQVPGGTVQSVASLPEAAQLHVLNQIKQTLGIAV